MTVIGTDLPWLPACHRVVAGLAAPDIDFGQDFLNVLLRIPFLLFLDIEGVHAPLSRWRFAGIMPLGGRDVLSCPAVTAEVATATKIATVLGGALCSRSRIVR